MENDKLLKFLDAQITKYDKMALDAMQQNNLALQMHFNGYSTAFWTVKSFIEKLENEKDR